MNESTDSQKQLEQLSETLFDTWIRIDPFVAGVFGVTEAAAFVPAHTAEDRGQLRDTLVTVAREVDAIEDVRLTEQDKITKAMVGWDANVLVDSIDADRAQFTVSPFSRSTPGPAVVAMGPKAVIATVENAQDYLACVQQIASMLDSTLESHREGVQNGRAPVASLVNGAIRQLDGFMEGGGAERAIAGNPLRFQWDGEQVWRDQLDSVVRAEVVPALRRYRQGLEALVLPASRTDEKSGLCWIPGGEEEYLKLVREHTTTEKTPEEIHIIGLEMVEQLEDEARQLGSKLFGLTNLDEIRTRLREDRRLYFTSPEEMLEAAEANLSRFKKALPQFVARPPHSECEVLPMSESEAARSMAAYYRPGDAEESRPGAFFLNTYSPSESSRAEMPALAAHESIPGHHIQYSLARENVGLPRYRRKTPVSAFQEGWALYCERLVGEAGLFEDNLAMLGLWSLQSWRASRLVVDTGIHAKGWSREQARDYLRAHTITPERNVRSEVDRYIGVGGQALSYTLGSIEFAKLKDEAREELGSRFVLPEFHRALLGEGAVHLQALRGIAERWIQAHNPAHS